MFASAELFKGFHYVSSRCQYVGGWDNCVPKSPDFDSWKSYMEEVRRSSFSQERHGSTRPLWPMGVVQTPFRSQVGHRVRIHEGCLKAHTPGHTAKLFRAAGKSQ